MTFFLIIVSFLESFLFLMAANVKDVVTNLRWALDVLFHEIQNLVTRPLQNCNTFWHRPRPHDRDCVANLAEDVTAEIAAVVVDEAFEFADGEGARFALPATEDGQDGAVAALAAESERLLPDDEAGYFELADLVHGLFVAADLGECGVGEEQRELLLDHDLGVGGAQRGEVSEGQTDLGGEVDDGGVLAVECLGESHHELGVGGGGG